MTNCAGIFEQSMGARNRVGIGLSVRPARLHFLAVNSLESIPGLLKSLNTVSGPHLYKSMEEGSETKGKVVVALF